MTTDLCLEYIKNLKTLVEKNVQVENGQNINKYMKRCSTPLAIREKQLKSLLGITTHLSE